METRLGHSSAQLLPLAAGADPVGRTAGTNGAALVPGGVEQPPWPSPNTTSEGKLPKVPPGSTRLAFEKPALEFALAHYAHWRRLLPALKTRSRLASRGTSPVLNIYRRTASSLAAR